ncbi:MAG TPA: hypothetical protein VG184_10350 [Acidimicrobiales bacterium]|nr:hypothetical protein [Acidimicrobiales bacterium]
MTDTQEPDTQEPGTGEPDTEAVEAFVAQWRAELGEQGSISASHVQDRLLDLWGTLPDSSTRSEVERWLTETIERNLYQVPDINRRLQSVLASS